MRENDRDCLTSVIKNADTQAIGFRVEGRVRCIMGELKGIAGVMVATRTGGRVLIRQAVGVYIELPCICVVERMERRRRPDKESLYT